MSLQSSLSTEKDLLDDLDKEQEVFNTIYSFLTL